MMDWRQLPLWKHQAAAVEMVSKYLKVAHSQPATLGSALIRMPTGTGKSIVIAVLTRCLPGIKNALVITPSLALRQQLAKDIEHDVWDDILKVPSDPWPKKILELLPSNAATRVAAVAKESSIFVATIQTLHALSDGVLYERLSKNVQLIVF